MSSATFTAGMRNNNPGNIKYTPTINWQGQVGPSTNTDQGDPQVVFSSQAEGMRALARNVLTKYNNGATTIQQLVAAPGGWTPGYQAGANGVAAAAGIPVNQPIDMSNPSVLAQVMRGIVTQEHGPASAYYTNQMITDGISAATGQPVPPADIPDTSSDHLVGFPATAVSMGSSPAAPASIADLYNQHYSPVPLAPILQNVSGSPDERGAPASVLSAPGAAMTDAQAQNALRSIGLDNPAAPEPAMNSSGSPDDRSSSVSSIAALYNSAAGNGGWNSFTTPSDANSSLLQSVASGSVTGTVRNAATGASVPTSSGVAQSALTKLFDNSKSTGTGAPPPADTGPSPSSLAKMFAINSSGSPDDRQAANDARNSSIEYTGDGIAGTVQMPSGARPSSTPDMSNNGGWGAYASPASPSALAALYSTPPSAYDDSAPTSPSYTEHQVTTNVQKPNPAYQAWEADQSKAAMYGVEGVASPTLDANGNVSLPSSYVGAAPPPKFITVPQTTTVRVAAPAAPKIAAPQVVAPSPIQQLYGAPNGYVYQSNGNGGYTNVGTSTPNLTPSQQYAQAAQAAGGVAQGYASASSNNSHGYRGFGSNS